MTVLIPCSRTLSGLKALPRSSHILTRLISTNHHSRVTFANDTHRPSAQLQYTPTSLSTRLSQLRTFADGKPGRPAGRPKAHTGRSTAKRTTTKKAAAKPKPKSKAARPKKKAAAKPKPKPRPKKEPSAASLKRKEAKERTALKQQALLTGSPKALPDSAWKVCFVEESKKLKGQPLDKSGIHAKAAGQKYRNLSLEERERLNHIANENKTKNEAAYKKWVQSHTPLEIRQANHARNLLRQDAKRNNKKTTYPHIKDDRLVKQPVNSYGAFVKDRFDSGDMKGMTIPEASKLVSREWKDLSAAEKRAYDEKSAVDRNRYHEEHKSVYGFDPISFGNGASAAAAATAA